MSERQFDEDTTIPQAGLAILINLTMDSCPATLAT